VNPVTEPSSPTCSQEVISWAALRRGKTVARSRFLHRGRILRNGENSYARAEELEKIAAINSK